MTATGLPIVRAKDVMRSTIHYIDGMATLKEAAEKMQKENVTTLIVEKRSVDDAWGLVVERDLIRGVISADKRPELVHVYEIMSKPMITVTSDMDIRYVARLMNRIGIRRVPVEDCGELVGIVIQSDLIFKSNLF